MPCRFHGHTPAGLASFALQDPYEEPPQPVRRPSSPASPPWLVARPTVRPTRGCCSASPYHPLHSAYPGARSCATYVLRKPVSPKIPKTPSPKPHLTTTYFIRT